MISLDTSVLVRYLAQDHPEQSALATELLENTLSADLPGHVSALVLADLHRVLTQTYRVSRGQFTFIARGLLTAQHLHFENLQAAWNAVQAHEAGLDFVAALRAELAGDAGCDYTATFEPECARHPRARLLTRTL